jgi:hypothetical protein
VPGGRVVDQPKGRERAHRHGGRQQQQGPERELERRPARGASDRGAELDVGGGLQREQPADEEEERDREGFHE